MAAPSSTKERRPSSYPTQGNPIPEMDSVVATISGYTGLERSNLIKLINKTGGVYVGSLSPATTHLVCWAFKGEKYRLAKRLGTTIVNHRWFEDCLNARKHLPESPYTVLSGEAVGRLQFEELTVSPIMAIDLHTSHLYHGRKLLKMKLNGEKSLCPDDNSLNKAVCSQQCHKSYNDLQHSKKSILVSYNKSHALQNAEEDLTSRSLQKNSLYCDNSKLLKDTVPLSKGQMNDTFSDSEHASSLKCEGSSVTGSYKKENLCNQKPYSKYGSIMKAKSRGLVRKRPSSMLDFVTIEIGESSEQPPIQPIEVNQPYIHIQQGNNVGGNAVDLASSVEDDKVSSDMIYCNTDLMEAPDAKNEASVDSSTTMRLANLTERNVNTDNPDSEIACVICHAETTAEVEGILSCGHRFCFLCIQQWAFEGASKLPTCPLCKAAFDLIMRREKVKRLHDVQGGSQSVCTQYDENLVILGGENTDQKITSITDSSACIFCGSKDTEELLLRCNRCNKRSAHIFCLDPPWPPIPDSPWYCGRCTQSRRVDTRWWHVLHGVGS